MMNSEYDYISEDGDDDDDVAMTMIHVGQGGVGGCAG